MATAKIATANPPQKLHYFKLCYRDWCHGTRGMALAVRMFYLELCLWSWDKQKPLPPEPEKIARDIGVTAEEWALYWPDVVGKFRRVKAGWWNPRVRRDVAEFRAEHRRKSEGGKKGAARRWGTPEAARDTADDFAASQAEYAQNPPSVEPVFAPARIGHGPWATPSQEAYERATNPHHKPTNLINGASLRRHGSHAWCSPRDGLCVPQFLHEEFLGKSNKPHADLLAWYASTIAALNGHAVGEDALVFWRNSFGQWVGVVTAAPNTHSKTARSLQALRSVLTDPKPVKAARL